MSDDSNNNATGIIAKKVSELVDESPGAKDNLKETVVNLSKITALTTRGAAYTVENAGKLTNMLIASGIYVYQSSVEYLSNVLPNKVNNIPIDKLKEPRSRYLLEAAQNIGKFDDSELELKEMFANLVAGSMHTDIDPILHPGFSKVIETLSVDESRILKFMAKLRISHIDLIEIRYELEDKKGYFVGRTNLSTIGFNANCKHPELIDQWISGLARNMIIHWDNSTKSANEDVYKKIKESTLVKNIVGKLEDEGVKSISYHEFRASCTPFGEAFIKSICT